MSELQFDIWRILGNDLPPRHSETQTLDNLKFILEREATFDRCRKLFLLNRILDANKKNKLAEIITDAGHEVYSIEFDASEFSCISSMQDRVKYLTNVNAARNFCVQTSLSQGVDVVCPMDGGMFFTENGFRGFQILADENEDDGFFAFTTWRLVSYDDVVGDSIVPQFKSVYHFGEDTVSYGMTELQLALTKNADQRFDDSLMYGRADKVEFLYRLGLQGLWDHWEPNLRKQALSNASNFYGKVKLSLPGYVCRLPSGNTAGDHHNLIRGSLRTEGINNLLSLAGS